MSAQEIIYFCSFLAGPSLLLIVPFLIVCLIRKVPKAFLKAMLLYFMCVVFEWGWWYVLFAYREPNNPGPGFIFFIIIPW